MRHSAAAPSFEALAQPTGTENHRKAEKNSETGPCNPIECRFSTAGTAEHGAATSSQATHPIALGAMQQHQNDQQDTAADPGPRENGGEHQTG